MHRYTAAQFPEILLEVQCSNRHRAPFFALKKLVDLTRINVLDAKNFDGFSSQSLVEVADKDLMSQNEEKLTNAIKTLTKLSQARKIVQEKQEEALANRKYIEILFSNKKLLPDDFKNIKESLETIKLFAQANLRYKEALANAEEAKIIVDKALESIDSANEE
ncbi:hypothetical protein [Vacuolonema iberomarrocanum]|uniref:hypothetical protein n=1 Tax=Vacuolonema iberomarrocanum TaxID=3454632 RepID=UPI001A097204|nr:hypothetical protein [filamentous cyanobacterium LEGE 07170]